MWRLYHRLEAFSLIQYQQHYIHYIKIFSVVLFAQQIKVKNLRDELQCLCLVTILYDPSWQNSSDKSSCALSTIWNVFEDLPEQQLSSLRNQNKSKVIPDSPPTLKKINSNSFMVVLSWSVISNPPPEPCRESCYHSDKPHNDALIAKWPSSSKSYGAVASAKYKLNVPKLFSSSGQQTLN